MGFGLIFIGGQLRVGLNKQIFLQIPQEVLKIVLKTIYNSNLKIPVRKFPSLSSKNQNFTQNLPSIKFLSIIIPKTIKHSQNHPKNLIALFRQQKLLFHSEPVERRIKMRCLFNRTMKMIKENAMNVN